MDYKTAETSKKEVVLGMESESKYSVNGTQKIVVLFGTIFCTVVGVLLVILYYPSDSEEKEFEDDFRKVTSPGHLEDWQIISPGGGEASKTRVEDVAKAMQDFGAAFLALLAVCCVAVGLTCLFCACCVLK